MPRNVPPLAFTLKYETAVSLLTSMTTTLAYREQVKEDGYPTLIEQWDENLKPLYEYILKYIDEYS